MTDFEGDVQATGPVLVFGGPYGNLQATVAILAEAERRGIPADHIICTGDLVAYCGAPVETVAAVVSAGIHVVMGNCEEQLAADADDCGCGFESDTACDRLSAAWYGHARRVLGPHQKRDMAGLPRAIRLSIGGLRFLVVHGGVSQISRFIFATTPNEVKQAEFALAEQHGPKNGLPVDGIIGGHCGLPFSQVVGSRLWHNPGVVGMPANDGTPRVWFSVLTPLGNRRLAIEHAALSYDHHAAASAVEQAGLPDAYRLSLSSGLWPNCDVLPEAETRQQGRPLAPANLIWEPARDTNASPVLWPEGLSNPGLQSAA